MNRKIYRWIILSAGLLLAAAVLFNLKGTAGQNNCFYGDVDYASVLQWGGVVYSEDYDSPPGNAVKGQQLGKITYRRADHQCPRTEMRDGDSTLLEVGTELYEVSGYKTSARLWAGDRLFVADSNPDARTLNDLLDISDKITAVRFISGMDGTTHLMDFTPEAADLFIKEFPMLKYIPFEQLYKETKGWVGDKYWLEIELKDGTAMPIIYNTLSPSFNPPAYAIPELAQLIEQQRKLIYAK
ncbi:MULTISPECIES: hypothetical protein [unclassified Paenibacillus]|uniref:hypothetical protein n=1 Tax=unclassified Paenibacillus TaxID=185978 RepID=UPI0024068332|nr:MULTISPECIES: hypothetical protein [unclassified Paenibacillus]MDF9843310.1 hypothetical protein [Paenibacillus sp. PastF-2]MDF9849898.1 hypothetical protein [Paenibacillus sp. PastM-2]MDF9856606.1 hypothetical protein [Paenibacillus sp. PastF-1]MDH6481875.1 hypothetical protein [Paenibacillus sp. PastH-2]MDH6509037.1 hypothetical protein [Paenibacillus sp. PastM-3]